jgi:hypothetical protein
MQSPPKGFGPTLHKFYAPHCTLSNIAVQQAPDWPSPIRYAVMDYLVWGIRCISIRADNAAWRGAAAWPLAVRAANGGRVRLKI